MGQFKLKANAGPHKQDGVVYRAGDIVETDLNLAKLFPGKFEVLDGKQPVFMTPVGGRTGNELRSDHAGRDVYENDAETDRQAKEDNADLDDEDADLELASNQPDREGDDDEEAPRRSSHAKGKAAKAKKKGR